MELRLGRGGSRSDSLRGGDYQVLSRYGLPPSMRLLADALPPGDPGEVLVGHDAEGVLAMLARDLWPDAKVIEHHLDAYNARRALQTFERNGISGIDQQLCADLPGVPGPGSDGFPLIVLYVPKGSDRLLTLEWLEQAHDRLRIGGRLLIATPSPPQWKTAMKGVFGKVDLQGFSRGEGAVLTARRTKERLRTKSREHEIRVDYESSTLHFATRPGVFLYGRVDSGTRALLQELPPSQPGRVLDLGCGVGILGICAATWAGAKRVTLVDCNSRAVELAEANAKRNGFEEVRACLRADLEELPGGPFELILANPPYFGAGRIAESFARCAARSMAEGGRLRLVAKAVPLHREILESFFTKVELRDRDGYGIFDASKPRGQGAG